MAVCMVGLHPTFFLWSKSLKGDDDVFEGLSKPSPKKSKKTSKVMMTLVDTYNIASK